MRGGEYCVRIATISLRTGRLKGAERHFFLHSVLQGDRYPLLFGEWTFPWGERGEMLDECKECSNETTSFVFLNLKENSRFVLNFLNPA